LRLPRLETLNQSTGKVYVPPANAIEEKLTEIWASVLGVEKISTKISFFEAGGHSLLATQVMARVREAFQIELPLREFFAAPTIAGLGAVIETRVKSGATGLEPGPIRLERKSRTLKDPGKE
jgi:acyl carrier protein